MTTFDIANKLLREGLPVGSGIQAIQISLKLLGFMPHNGIRQCDGKWGRSTDMAIQALNWAIFEHQAESIVPYVKITDLLLNKNIEWFKTPFVADPKAENRQVVELLEAKKDYIVDTYDVPYEFLKAVLWQETNLSHYDPDGFVFVGCDTGKIDKYKYRSRGWGMGQYTITNHPPDEGQQKNIIDPINNLEFCIGILNSKFDIFCKRDFVRCRYKKGDEKYLKGCVKCVELSDRCNVQLPDANYHPKAQAGYKNVPVLSYCGWGEATRKYNGGGPNSIAYKYEVLMKILGQEIR